MKSYIFLIILLVVFLFTGCVGNETGPDNTQRRFDMSDRRPFNRSGMNMTDGNFSRPMMMNLTEEQITEISEVFENSDSVQLEAYCQEKGMECGYYCTRIDPDHEFCIQYMNNFINRREVSR